MKKYFTALFGARQEIESKLADDLKLTEVKVDSPTPICKDLNYP